MMHIDPFIFNSLLQSEGGIKLYCDRTHFPSRYLSYNLVYASFSLSLPLSPLFLFGHFSGPLLFVHPTCLDCLLGH